MRSSRAVAAALLVLLVAAAANAGSVNRPKVWNVLLVTIDDVSQHQWPDVFPAGVANAGAGYLTTPALESLADAGVRFDRFYLQPRCGASRTVFLSGRAGYRTQVLAFHGSSDNHLGELELPSAVDWLASEDIDTAAFGKFGVSVAGRDYDSAAQLGWDSHYGFIGAAIGSYKSWPRVDLTEGVLAEDPPLTSTIYVDDSTVDDAIAWIAARERHWLAYVSLVNAHTPAHQASILPTYPGDCSSSLETCYREQAEEADAQLGRLIATIDPTTTLVLVVGDNGGLYPSPGGKFTDSEKGWNVGAVAAYGPIVNPGRSTTALHGGVDFLPTILEAMTGSIWGPANHPDLGEPSLYRGQARIVDGVSLFPALLDVATGGNPYVTAEGGSANVRIHRDSDPYAYHYISGVGDHFYLLPDEVTNLIVGGLSGPEQTACDELKSELWRRTTEEGWVFEAYGPCS